MASFLINGGKGLCGKVVLESSKNAVLPMIASSLLTKEKVVLHNVPRIKDVDNMVNIIRHLGGSVVWNENSLIIKNSQIENLCISNELTSALRSSVFMLGPMLSMYKYAKVAYPGGCEIGARPIDIHISGLRKLGVKINEENDFIECDGKTMVSNTIHLNFPSVGATENLVMASVLLKGETILYNVAREPEIIDLANFINKMGGKIEGAGTSTIKITGVERLNGTEYTPMSDRIVAGTYMIACASTKGKIEIENIDYKYILSLIDKLRKSGCQVESFGGRILVENFIRPKPCSFSTWVYPGFPTDLQPQLSAYLAIAEGKSVVRERIFETRFKHLNELTKMGASVKYTEDIAIIDGVPVLYGAEVDAYDLRGGASMVIAGLTAKGTTRINNIQHIDRGYSEIECQLQNLGADIIRVDG